MHPYLVTSALTLVWLGMIFAISFIEAPLKFRAPRVTIQIGLGIGRLVFKALNTAEFVIATIATVFLCVSVFANHAPFPAIGGSAFFAGFACLIAQIIFVRPVLNKRSDEVLSQPDVLPKDSKHRSTAHFWYVGIEMIKTIALIVAATQLLGL